MFGTQCPEPLAGTECEYAVLKKQTHAEMQYTCLSARLAFRAEQTLKLSGQDYFQQKVLKPGINYLQLARLLELEMQKRLKARRLR